MATTDARKARRSETLCDETQKARAGAAIEGKYEGGRQINKACHETFRSGRKLKESSSRDRSIPRTMQRFISTKFSISQLSFFLLFFLVHLRTKRPKGPCISGQSRTWYVFSTLKIENAEQI
ncbi:unnamed protein product, partial [Laminaria digitata]